MTKDDFITRAIAVHGNKYDYSKVEYINSATKVCIICPEHGEFWQTPNCHLSGNGCPKCAGNLKHSKDDFIKRSIAVNGNKYDYSKVEYINSKTKVCIICPEHGEFWQTPDSHYTGQGCPKCGIVKGSSKRRLWTIEKCKEVAKLCANRSELQKKYSRAYEVLSDNNLLYELYPKLRGYWNIFENVEKEAKKYKSRWDFGKNNISAYKAARRNNWLDRLFPNERRNKK